MYTTLLRVLHAMALLLMLVLIQGTPTAQAQSDARTAPDSFQVAFETTKGRVVIQVNTAWAPIGAQRLYELATDAGFDEAPFYRVVPGFVAQFGQAGDAEARREDGFFLPDEPVRASNQRGTIAYARGGPNSRGTHLYINLRDNSRLDALDHNGVLGFPPIGRVIEGMDVIDQLYGGYANSVNQNLMQTQGLPYLHGSFPEMDYIKSSELLKEWR